MSLRVPPPLRRTRSPPSWPTTAFRSSACDMLLGNSVGFDPGGLTASDLPPVGRGSGGAQPPQPAARRSLLTNSALVSFGPTSTALPEESPPRAPAPPPVVTAPYPPWPPYPTITFLRRPGRRSSIMPSRRHRRPRRLIYPRRPPEPPRPRPRGWGQAGAAQRRDPGAQGRGPLAHFRAPVRPGHPVRLRGAPRPRPADSAMRSVLQDALRRGST